MAINALKTVDYRDWCTGYACYRWLTKDQAKIRVGKPYLPVPSNGKQMALIMFLSLNGMLDNSVKYIS